MAAPDRVPKVLRESVTQIRAEMERLLSHPAFFALWVHAAFCRWRCHELGAPLDFDHTKTVLPETWSPELQDLWIRYFCSSIGVMQWMSDASELLRDRFSPFTVRDTEDRLHFSLLFIYFYTRSVLSSLGLEPPENLPFWTRNVAYRHPYYITEGGLKGYDGYVSKKQYYQWQAHQRYWYPGKPGRPLKEKSAENPAPARGSIDPGLARKAAHFAASLPESRHKIRQVAAFLWPDWHPKSAAENRQRWHKTTNLIHRGKILLAKEKVHFEN